MDLGTGGSTGSGQPGVSAPPVRVPSYFQEDFALSYEFRKGMFKGITLTAGIDNAFNRNIPVSTNAFPDTYGDVGFYNGAVGRMYYFDCDYKF